MQAHEPVRANPIRQWPVLLGLAVVACTLAWSLWPELTVMVERWSRDARYSHGWLVPLFSLALLYHRRGNLPAADTLKPSIAWGLALLILGVCTQLTGAFVGSPWVIGLALLPYLLGVAAVIGGTPVVRWALPSVLFLVFMIPLPWRFEVMLGPPLQQVATRLSTYALQTVGLMAFASGNIIRIGDFRIGVVEACSGLSMLMTFGALSVAVALVVKRPWLDRIVLVLAAVPVALIANTARIVLTGILYAKVGRDTAEHFYHDLAGWLMIPFALGLLWLMAKAWSWLLVEDEVPEKIPVVVGLPVAETGAARSRQASPDSKAQDRKASSTDKRRRNAHIVLLPAPKRPRP
jgi:exosortase